MSADAERPPVPGFLQRMRARARALKREVLALYLACRDPRVPWYAKALGALVVAYALSPVDLIPDFIPVLGYLDDVILVPAGIALALRLIPADVMDDCRARAASIEQKPTSWVAGALIVATWLALAALAARWAFRFYGARSHGRA